MLLQLSQFFPLLPHSVTPLPQSIPSPLFMSMGPAYKLPIPFPILYFTSPWLFCDYQFVLLNPLNFSQPPTPLTPLGTIKVLSRSMILSLSFLFA